ncbi:MAG: sulfur carrier protein ThiS adenylyltransferase ThiF [Spirochaetes bacterium]|nr:sulfur carrier protein ThiS adenylyltransferase ThiF [Spirochaetota bacterium]
MQAQKITESALLARNIPGINEKLKKSGIAIAGLGGLGSNIAVMLARIGVGKLLLVDYDVVEPGNLNRQYYDTTHIGLLKTEALKSQINKINPFVDTEAVAVKIEAGNVLDVFKDYSIVCEAFDDPQYKAILVNALLEAGGKKIIAASGMNGYGSANNIKTKRTLKNLYVCGDSMPAEQDGIGFMAPRVIVCAAHQANMALRLLLNIEEE